ncbi:enediyne antibiotic chromoprotein, partial [Streptosporangium canum]|uniref:enediyne antibiotic chromoprotein n=1 Tax=Streptosporangium canum TaxID=324952 RepID=UPI0037932A0C
LIAKLGATAALALGLGLAFQPAAGAATTPTAGASTSGASIMAASISVAPATGLTDNTTVTITATGLQPGSVYHLGQCAAVRPDAFACNAATNVDVTASATGTLTKTLTVRAAFTGSAADNTTWPINTATTPTVIAVFNNAFDGGTTPLSF